MRSLDKRGAGISIEEYAAAREYLRPVLVCLSSASECCWTAQLFKTHICHGAQRAVQIEGLPEMPIHGIELDNVQISARTGFVFADAERIKLTNVQITPTSGPVFLVKDSRDVSIDRSRAGNAGVFLRVEGEKSRGISITATDLSRVANPLEFDKGASKTTAAIRR